MRQKRPMRPLLALCLTCFIAKTMPPSVRDIEDGAGCTTMGTAQRCPGCPLDIAGCPKSRKAANGNPFVANLDNYRGKSPQRPFQRVSFARGERCARGASGGVREVRVEGRGVQGDVAQGR